MEPQEPIKMRSESEGGLAQTSSTLAVAGSAEFISTQQSVSDIHTAQEFASIIDTEDYVTTSFFELPPAVLSHKLQTLQQSESTDDVQPDASSKPKSKVSIVYTKPLLVATSPEEMCSEAKVCKELWLSITLAEFDARRSASTMTRATESQASDSVVTVSSCATAPAPDTALTDTILPSDETSRDIHTVQESASASDTQDSVMTSELRLAVASHELQTLQQSESTDDIQADASSKRETLDNIDYHQTLNDIDDHPPTAVRNAMKTSSSDESNLIPVTMQSLTSSSSKEEQCIVMTLEEYIERVTTPGTTSSATAVCEVVILPQDLLTTATLTDSDAMTSNHLLDAKTSQSSLSPAPSAVTSLTSSYVTVTSTCDDADKLHYVTEAQESSIKHQPDIALQTLQQFESTDDIQADASSKPETLDDINYHQTLNDIDDHPPTAMKTSSSEESNLIPVTVPDTSPIKPQKNVSFLDDDDDQETPAVDRRETPFVWDLLRDGSLNEEGPSDVDISKTLDSERVSSQPDVAYHARTFASTSSLPPSIDVNADTDVQAVSTQRVVTEISPHAALDGHDGIEQKSDHISSRVSAFLPTLPDHLEDENVPATRVSSEQTSVHTRETIDVSPFAFDISEVEQDVEDEEEHYPDVQPELSTESLESLEPLELLPVAEDTAVKFDAGSDKVREYDEVPDLEDQFAQVSINVDDMDGRMSTLEPRRSLREIVYISLHEEKQVKGTDYAETDKEHGDAKIQSKSPVAEYDAPADDNRQKSIIDHFIPVPPVASESGIVMTLEDYDNGNFTKLRMSKAEQINESLSTDSNDDIAAFFSNAIKTPTETAADDTLRPRMTVSGTKVFSARTSDAYGLMAKRRRKSTFVEEMLTENKRKVSHRPLKKVTPAPVPEEVPPPAENEPVAVAEPSYDENVMAVETTMAVESVVDVVVPQRQRSSTLLVALNRDTECDFNTGDDLHVALRPTSMSFRYIVSPHAQYAGNRSQTKESTLEPSRCKPPPTAGVEKEDSPINLPSAAITAAEPVKPTNTDHTSTEEQTADDSNTLSPSAQEQAADNSNTLSPSTEEETADDSTLPSQAIKTSPDSVSAYQQLLSITEPSSAFAGTPPHRKPSAGQVIHMTLADWDREDEDVVGKASWSKWNWDIMHAPSRVPASRQPSPLDLHVQRSSNDDVITVSLDTYDRYDDKHQSYPVFISGRVMSQVKKSLSASHDSDAEGEYKHHSASSDPGNSSESQDSGVEKQDKHYAVPADLVDSSKSQDSGVETRDEYSAVPAEPVDSSDSEDSDAETEDKHYDELQPANSNDIDGASDTAEIETPPEPEAAASDIGKSNTEQVTPTSVTAFSEEGETDTAAKVDNIFNISLSEIETPPEPEAAASDISQSNTEQVPPTSVTASSEKGVTDTAANVDNVFNIMLQEDSDVGKTRDVINGAFTRKSYINRLIEKAADY